MNLELPFTTRIGAMLGIELTNAADLGMRSTTDFDILLQEC
jgi:hypothetical protein